ncbi:MAG: DNA alkylation repair protein [Anaerolineaceae bacterium]|nr:DNA alkylation repair protein [Anaerolineaceae bacterium]
MAEALKDMFFKEIFFETLCSEIVNILPSFDRDQFLTEIYAEGWENRALKDRMRHTTLTLHQRMPKDFRDALDILYQLLPRLESFGFEKMIFPDYVELYGLEDWEAALPAFEKFTQSMSAEFAVRPFIIQDQERMMAQMLTWSQHENPQVRRLASEGCRPRLPWAVALPALQKDPSLIFPILSTLIRDPEETVRRSVANNLNDITKDHPQAVVDFLKPYQAENTAEIAWITNHALRSLLKAGFPSALAMQGYGDISDLRFENFEINSNHIPWEGSLEFSFSITSEADEPLDVLVDYAICFLRKNGKQSRKVFKLTKRTIQPGETILLKRKHSFAPITTRVYYPGEQAVEVQLNGETVGRMDFNLMPE